LGASWASQVHNSVTSNLLKIHWHVACLLAWWWSQVCNVARIMISSVQYREDHDLKCAAYKRTTDRIALCSPI
jgi:hypothetical protein